MEGEGDIGVSEEGLGETGTYFSSVVWGNSSRLVTQAYNEYAPGYYSYAADVCMAYDHHPGIDIGMPNGTPIYAATGGTVIQMGCSQYFRPRPVHVRTDSGEVHIYGHLQSNSVVLNQRVERGTLLGHSGEQTVSGSCSTPDGTGPHLHFERRSGTCAINPVSVLSGTGTPVPSGFAVGDKIQVFDGPLNVRSQPSTSGALVAELATGTQMCVTGSPQSANGYTWYQINANGVVGWVAGNFCSLVAAGGCKTSTGPTPIPSSGWVIGDVLYTNNIGVRLRASASASGAILHDGLPNGTRGVMVGGPVSADGYTWYQWDTRYGRGWSASTWMAETTAYTNRLANPTADSSLSSILANQTSTTLSRVSVNGNYAVKVANAGSTSTEGARYESAALSLTGARYISGVVDVYGAGTLDYVRVRISYTDGTSTWGSVAPATTLSSGAWKRIVMPVAVAASTKTINKIYVYAVKNTPAGAMTYQVDNAKAIEL
ncbi:peptidoglycan DD-metalloendopeptidase family protein [Archangium gephyra]|uniref:peptidoglycan DD-metalloendopeptidase family protein n=1 Tax=Archangium gephyra TaxID=48 RepID=UPI003B7AD67D